MAKVELEVTSSTNQVNLLLLPLNSGVKLACKFVVRKKRGTYGPSHWQRHWISDQRPPVPTTSRSTPLHLQASQTKNRMVELLIGSS